MIEISQLKSDLLLETVAYGHLIQFINNSLLKYPNFDMNMNVIIYIDSTGQYDYLMRIEGTLLNWNWQLYSYEPTGSYVVVRATLDEVIKHIRVYQQDAPMQ